MNFSNAGIGFVLSVLAFVLLVAVASRAASARRRRILTAFVGPVLAERLTRSLDPRRRRRRFLLYAAGMILVGVAAARPWWGARLIPMPRRSRDILVAIDCSKSMLARDVAPNRLEYAKWWVRSLVQECPGDRFGLIAFAGTAFPECPLTQDRNTFFQFLDLLDTRTIPVGGTNIAEALHTARRAFRAAESGHRAVILISDGEELQGNADEEAERLAKNDIPLFVVGLGNPERSEVIRLPDNSLLRDKNGRIVRTRLNEAALRRLAEMTNGIYVRATTTHPNLEAVLRRVRALVPEEHKGGAVRRPVERYQIFLFPAVLLLLLWLCASERKRPVEIDGRVRAVLLALALTCPGANSATGAAHADRSQSQSTAEAASDTATKDSQPAPPTLPFKILPPDGKTPPAPGSGSVDRPFSPGMGGPVSRGPADTPTPSGEQAKIREEIEATEKELDTAPSEQRARLHFNLGYLWQRAGDLAKAASEYEKAIALAGDQPAVLAAAHWNLGTVRHAEGRTALLKDPQKAIEKFQTAREMYREALRLRPEDTDLAADVEMLDRDEMIARKVLEKQKELEQMRRDAVEKTAKALKAQKEAGKAKNEDEAAAKTRQAQNLTKEAEKAAERLEKEISKLGKSPLAERAQKARQELEKAQEAQEHALQAPRSDESRREERKKAEKSLERALGLLGGRSKRDQQQKQGQRQQQDKKKSGQQTAESRQNEQKQQNLTASPDLNQQLQQQKRNGDEKQAAAGSEENGEKKKEYDTTQIEALLHKMAEREEDLRRALKEQQLQRYKLRPVDRDW